MADFDIPFGQEADEKRFPDQTEKELGFPCGPADRNLFTGIVHRLEAECKSIIDEAGITHTDANMRCVLDAILALIGAATGGGPTEDYILMSQARTRLLFYPEVVSSTDGLVGVSAPSTGTVRLLGGSTIRHRGIFDITTGQTDFATVSNKTYHLTGDLTGAGTFALKDLADGVYNPGAVAEANSLFDSTYDKALLARVTTNSSNVSTITPLVNKHKLFSTQAITPTNVQGGVTNSSRYDVIAPLNWSRTPKLRNWNYLRKSVSGGTGDDYDVWVYELGGWGGDRAAQMPGDRYRIAFTTNDDNTAGAAMLINVVAAA